jgi:hypothetical protein
MCISCSGLYAHPSFQPVTENVFLADPIVMVRSCIAGKDAAMQLNQVLEVSAGKKEPTHSDMLIRFVNQPLVHFIHDAEHIVLLAKLWGEFKLLSGGNFSKRIIW